MYPSYFKNILHHPVPQHGHVTKQTWKRGTVETIIITISHLNKIAKKQISDTFLDVDEIIAEHSDNCN